MSQVRVYGVRGISLDWFRNYLLNRKQYVNFNGVSSELKCISGGVPQGSILGPLLFILYINDVVHCSSILKFILFADDTNLFYSNRSATYLMNIVNEELLKLCDWFRANKLALNIKKTNFILFGRRGKNLLNNNFGIKMDNIAIEKVNATKF